MTMMLVSLTLTWMAPENGWLSPNYSPFGAKGLFSMGLNCSFQDVSDSFDSLCLLGPGPWICLVVVSCQPFENGSQTWLWWRCFNNLTNSAIQNKGLQKDANPHKSDASIKGIITINNIYRHRHIITARFSKQFQNSTHIEVIFGLCRPQCFFSRSGCRLRASSRLWVVRASQNTIPILIPAPNSPFGIKWLTINVWWCSMFDDSEYHIVLVDLKLQNLGKTIVEAATQLLLSLLSEV